MRPARVKGVRIRPPLSAVHVAVMRIASSLQVPLTLWQLDMYMATPWYEIPNNNDHKTLLWKL
jgi:hypothetical protein